MIIKGSYLRARIVLSIVLISLGLSSTSIDIARAAGPEPVLTLQTSGGTIRDSSVISTGTAMTVSVGGLLQQGTGSRELRIDLDAGTVYQSGGVTAPEGWTIEYSTNNGSTWATTEPSPASGVTNVRASNASVVAGPTDGASQLYTRAVTSNVPASTFGASTGGDGWDVFFYDNYVLNIFHHNDSSLPLDCHLRSGVGNLNGGDRCPGFNPTDSNQSDGTGSLFPGYQTADRSGGWVNGTTGKMYAFTAQVSSGKPGVLCVNLDVTPPTACGFTALSADTNVSSYGSLSNAEGIGGRLFGMESQNNKLLCFDPATSAACAGSPISLSATGTNNTGYYHVLALGSKVFASTNTTLYCFESATLAPCAGAWPVTYASLSWTAPEMPPVAHMSASGSIDGVCVFTGCLDLLGAARTGAGWVNPFSVTQWNSVPAYSGQYGKFETTAGRAFMAEILSSPGVYCFDYSTEAACTNWDTTPFDTSTNQWQGGSLYALRADPTNPNCIFWNSDPGNIGLFSATDGAPSCAGNPIITMQPSQFAPRFVCTSSGGIDRWKSIKLVSVAGGTASSQSLTIRKANGDAITGWTSVPLTVGTTTDLSSLAVSESGSRPTFNVAFTGVTGSLTSAVFDIIYEGRGPELCVNTTLNNASISGSPACPVVQSIVGKLSENVSSAVSGTALSRTFTISGDAVQCPQNIKYAGPPNKPTDVTCTKSATGANLTFKAPTDNGGSNIRWYEVSLDGGTTWRVLTSTLTSGTYSASVTASTTGVTSCLLRAVNVLGTSANESATLAETPKTVVTSTTVAPTTVAPTTTVPKAAVVASPKVTEAMVKFVPITPTASVTSYEYSLNGGKTWKTTKVSTMADGRLAFNVSGLDAATKYTVSIRAVTTGGAKVSQGSTRFTTKSTLPSTGSNPQGVWMFASGLILGGALLLIARRRVEYLN